METSNVKAGLVNSHVSWYRVVYLRVLWSADANYVTSGGQWGQSADQGQNVFWGSGRAADSLRDSRIKRFVSDDLLPQLPDDFPIFMDDAFLECSLVGARTASCMDSETNSIYRAFSDSLSASFSSDDMDCSVPVNEGVSPPATLPADHVPVQSSILPHTPQKPQMTGDAIKHESPPVTAVITQNEKTEALHIRRAAPRYLSTSVPEATLKLKPSRGKTLPGRSQTQILNQLQQQQRQKRSMVSPSQIMNYYKRQ